MYDLYKELERTCERSAKELHDLNDRLEQNKNVISPADLDVLVKITDIIKDVKSTMKKIDEMEMMEENQNEYSGRRYSGKFMSQPMWDNRYSGNYYDGTYTLNTGSSHDGYSGRRNMSMYSRGNERDELAMRLGNMLNQVRDPKEADALRNAIDILNRD